MKTNPNPNHKYGVGWHSALKSRRVGTLHTASIELRNLIGAGVDPRSLQILPVQACPKCEGKGEFFSKWIKKQRIVRTCTHCNGFKYVVFEPDAGSPNGLNEPAIPGEQVTAAFMSHATTTADRRRTWLVRKQGDFPALVRIYPHPADDVLFSLLEQEGGIIKGYVCDCKQGKQRIYCIHVEVVAALDNKRFFSTGDK